MVDQLTLYRLFKRGVRLGQGRKIKSFGAENLIMEQSYEQFASDVLAIAAYLIGKGIKPGDRIATLATNSIRHLQLMWAIPLAGGVYHGINPRLSEQEIIYIIGDAKDSILFLDEKIAGLWTSLENVYPRLETVFISRASRGETDVLEDYLGREHGSPFEIEELVTDENAAAVMCYTSGTTGPSKGVIYSHRALTLHALMETMVDGYAINHADHVLLMVPFCHGAGWGVPFSAFMTGADISIFNGSITAPIVTSLLVREQITFTAAVPEVILQIATQIGCDGLKFNNVRILMGGAAPKLETLHLLQEAGITSLLCWGMTETLSAATVQWVSPAHESIIITQGHPLPLTELKIDMGEDVSNELLVKGPCVVDQYYGQNKTVRKDGWLRTGDAGYLKEDGTLILQDRMKDLIKSAGEWISPSALEEVILKIKNIRECTVVGVPHPHWGERPLCIITISNDIDVRIVFECLMRSKKFAKWQLPDDVVVLNCMPLTTVGKIDREVLKKKYEDYYQ